MPKNLTLCEVFKLEAMKPILPMRPTFAGILKTEDDLRTVLSLPNVIIQPKLGGDRVTLHRAKDAVCAFNRKGEPYKFKFDRERWMHLPKDTALDGEVYQGQFYPFDCLRYNGSDLMPLPASERVEYAEETAETIGLGFVFRTHELDRLAEMMERNQGKGQRMMWEGVVVKDANSPYVPLTNYRQESYTWRKYKWM